MFTVNLIVEDNILSTANITQQQLDEVINGIELAASLWSRYIDGNNAVIDISLGFEDLSESTLAEAGSTFFTRNNGPIESEVINELNGQSGEFSTDGQFTIDLPSLKNDRFFFADSLDFEQNPGEQGQIDFLTLAAHELGHVLGFLDLSFEGFVVNNQFIGENAVAANGGNPIPLADGVHTDGGDLLSPFIISNLREPINEVLVAILKDIGVPVVEETNGADTVYGFNQVDDTINGLAGDDILYGLTGNDTLLGATGRDRLFGGDGDDILDAGAGTGQFQFLYGEDGNDTYRYSQEDGRIFIDPRFEGAQDGSSDRILFEDLNSSDITIDYFQYSSAAIGNAIILKWENEGNSGEVRIGQEGQFIESYEFADGTVLTHDQLLQLSGSEVSGTDGDDTLRGTSGDDTILGLAGRDRLFGGDGDDILDAGAGTGQFQFLYGEDGNDTYRYSQEDGLVFIDPRFEGAQDGASDRILFEDLNSADITIDYFQYSNADIGNAIILKWENEGNSGEVRIGQEGQFIETYEFADGTLLTYDEVVLL